MKTKKLNFFERFLNFFENVGNKMPDPVTLSFILCILVIIISKFVATTGISAIHPKSGELIKIRIPDYKERLLQGIL